MHLPSAEKIHGFISSECVAAVAETAGRMAVMATFIIGMSEVTNHAEQVCETVQDTGAIVVTSVTGDVPPWAAHRTDPFAQEVMTAGPASFQPIPVEHCLPGFMLRQA